MELDLRMKMQKRYSGLLFDYTENHNFPAMVSALLYVRKSQIFTMALFMRKAGRMKEQDLY